MPAFVDLTELTHFHTPVCNLNCTFGWAGLILKQNWKLNHEYK
jgi:hypothetical protein